MVSQCWLSYVVHWWSALGWLAKKLNGWLVTGVPRVSSTGSPIFQETDVALFSLWMQESKSKSAQFKCHYSSSPGFPRPFLSPEGWDRILVCGDLAASCSNSAKALKGSNFPWILFGHLHLFTFQQLLSLQHISPDLLYLYLGLLITLEINSKMFCHNCLK